MKAIRKISLFIFGAILVTLFFSSCASGQASSRHSHPASGSKMF
jgi:hypothetical protein